MIDKKLKYLKDKAPKGEFLAYINAEEAAMLKRAGGSGKKVNGIPSFTEDEEDTGDVSNGGGSGNSNDGSSDDYGYGVTGTNPPGPTVGGGDLEDDPTTTQYSPSFTPNLSTPLGNFLGVAKDYVMGGGLLGMGIRGLTGLFDKVTGPKATEYGNLDIPGYNQLNISGPKDYPDFTPGDGPGNDDGNQGIMAAYNPYTLPVEEEASVSQEEKDFIQRFRVANEFRQDKQGQLDPAILEMISKLYT